eukprot:m.442643 g.442643  ORF g.442643 m.442643 type:complete len:73 (+) comp21476_c0_seq16:3278-3496(+)
MSIASSTTWPVHHWPIFLSSVIQFLLGSLYVGCTWLHRKPRSVAFEYCSHPLLHTHAHIDGSFPVLCPPYHF